MKGREENNGWKVEMRERSKQTGEKETTVLKVKGWEEELKVRDERKGWKHESKGWKKYINESVKGRRERGRS